MRRNQVSIFVERFGKYVPKDYPADVQRIHVYCDDGSSVYAALSKAYACVINELNEYEHIGARCDVSTNEFSYVDYREMHGTIPIVKREYDQDQDFEYYSLRQLTTISVSLRLLRILTTTGNTVTGWKRSTVSAITKVSH